MRQVVMLLLIGVFIYSACRLMLQVIEPWWKRS